jgi:hypothetical protein
MNTTQRLLELKPPTMLRLAEIERLIRTSRLIVPPPSRHTLIALCDDGTFETAPRRKARDPYLVTEDSFLKWVEGLSGKKR